MMAPVILFAARPERWPVYEPHLRAALRAEGVDDTALCTQADPADVDYIVYAPNSEIQDFTPYTRLKAVLNLWAGVENVVRNETLQVPLARMVDAGLTDGMVEWCVGHTMRYHLGLDVHIHGQDGIWRNEDVPPLARDRAVTVLGLGELGQATAQALAGLGFPVAGWSRSPKDISSIATYHGADGLHAALRSAGIIILLLPDTPATECILNARTLALVPRGTMIINPGRGPLIDDAALLDALGTGHIAHATLDVFRQEPLPADHPYWAHESVTVTPHIASETRPRTASQCIARNIARGEAGEPFLHLVDRNLGY